MGVGDENRREYPYQPPTQAGTDARRTVEMGKTDKDFGTGRLPKTRDEDK